MLPNEKLEILEPQPSWVRIMEAYEKLEEATRAMLFERYRCDLDGLIANFDHLSKEDKEIVESLVFLRDRKTESQVRT